MRIFLKETQEVKTEGSVVRYPGQRFYDVDEAFGDALVAKGAAVTEEQLASDGPQALEAAPKATVPEHVAAAEAPPAPTE